MNQYTNVNEENSQKSDSLTSNSFKRSLKKRANSMDKLSSCSDDDNGKFKNGRWLPCEHIRFLKGCLLYGNNWKKVCNCSKLNFFIF